MKRLLTSLSFVFFCVLACLAAEITGTWVGTVKTPNGENLEISYKLKSEGETLTGVVSSSYGDLALEDGKIKGDDFSFNLNFGNTKMESQGKLYTDSIVISSTINGHTSKNTFKRAVVK